MQRRSFLKLGIGSAAVLAVAGGAIALIQPGLINGKLSEGSRSIFTSAAKSLLDGTLPADPTTQQKAINGMLGGIDDLTMGLPTHVQAELSLLLSLLGTAAGRWALAGLSTDWASASIDEVSTALQSMRVSRVALRKQTYAALHDIVGGTFFSEPHTWPLMGYPGPRSI